MHIHLTQQQRIELSLLLRLGHFVSGSIVKGYSFKISSGTSLRARGVPRANHLLSSVS